MATDIFEFDPSRCCLFHGFRKVLIGTSSVEIGYRKTSYHWALWTQHIRTLSQCPWIIIVNDSRSLPSTIPCFVGFVNNTWHMTNADEIHPTVIVSPESGRHRADNEKIEVYMNR